MTLAQADQILGRGMIHPPHPPPQAAVDRKRLGQIGLNCNLNFLDCRHHQIYHSQDKFQKYKLHQMYE